MIAKKTIVAMIWCVFVCTNFAASGDEEVFCLSSDAPKTQTVYFGNGMKTTITGARNALLEIKDALRKEMPAEQFVTIHFETAYDNTDGFLVDFFDSAIQRLVSENLASRFWRYVASSEAMPAWLSDMGKQRIAENTVALMKATDFLPEHEMQYLEDIMSGKVVTVVAHSKGNINAGNVYQALRNTPGSPIEGISSRLPFNIEGVAVPTSELGTNGGYTTLLGDAVINTVAILSPAEGLPPPLPPNMFNTVAMKDGWQHSFLNAYMTPGSGSRLKILLFLKSIDLNPNLQQPLPPLISDGVFTVMALWGPDVRSDMDIHVDEPNNVHVAHNNMQGVAGRLDLVDLDGFGPEHYVASCKTLVPGRYRVGINYMSGDVNESVFVKVKAGNLVRTFRRDFDQACGDAGDAAQRSVPVAFVDVAGTQVDGFTFSIKEFLGVGGCK